MKDDRKHRTSTTSGDLPGFDRRGALRAMAGATLAAAGLGAAGCADDELSEDEDPSTGGDPLRRRIDTHHHVLPRPMKDWMEAEGLLEHVRDQPWTMWELGEALRVMNKHGIQLGVASMPAPSDIFAPRARAEAGIPILNDSLAGLMREHPTRFGAFAYLPLAHVDIALREIARADELGADGFMLMNHFGNKYLGDPAYEPIFAALNARGAVVMTHPDFLPSEAPGGGEFSPDVPGHIADFMLDTTRGALGLMFSGTLDRYPDITFILPHGGGFLPYVARRISHSAHRGEGLEYDKVKRYLDRFYFDTAAPMSPNMTPTLLSTIGSERLLYGTDYNQVPEPVLVEDLDAFRTDPALSARDKRRIARDNALRLLPSVAARLR